MFVSTKLNRNHLITGEQALILPCLGRTEKDHQATGEQFVSCENSMGVVQRSQGILAPISPHLMSETAIICNLAAATLGRNHGRLARTMRQLRSDPRPHRTRRSRL